MGVAFDIVVRSTEIDVNGHVNNAKYLEYLEWGREHWYEQHCLDYATLHSLGVITVVVHASVDFRAETRQNDNLQIQSELTAVGNTSFTMRQQIHKADGAQVIDAKFVIVTVNVNHRTKVRVPDCIRRLLPTGESWDKG